MNILFYTKKNNSYFLNTIYPSGRSTGKTRISKTSFLNAKKYAIENTDKLNDENLFISDNEILFTDK